MRPSSLVVFLRLIGAGGAGAYLGAAVAGLIAVATGQVFAAGSPWPQAWPVLALFGIAIGAGMGWVTRRWLLPNMRQRILVFTLTGPILLPLAIAVGQLHPLAGIGLPLIAVGFAVTAVLWIRWFRQRSTSRLAGR
jgi:hypothetical protein